MKKFLLNLLPLLTIVVACNEPEPRRAMQRKSGSFIQESVERSKQLLAAEEALIKNIIAKDSVNDYQSSSSGFWYVIEEKTENPETTLQTDDEALITYDLMNLNGDTIYSAKE